MKQLYLIFTLLVFIFVAHAENKNNQQQTALQELKRAQYPTLLMELSEGFNISLINLKSGGSAQNNSNITHKLDNLMVTSWYLSEKSSYKKEFTYDLELRNTTISEYFWDYSKKELFLYTKYEISYNQLGQLDNIQGYLRNQTSGEFELFRSVDFKYNPNGLLASVINSDLVYGTFNVTKRESYTYNESKQLIQSDLWTKVTDDYNGLKANDTRFIFKYNELGYELMSSKYPIINGEPVLYSITENKYNEDGNLTSTELHYKLAPNNEWYSKLVYIYNSEGDNSTQYYYQIQEPTAGNMKYTDLRVDINISHEDFISSSVASTETSGIGYVMTYNSSSDKAVKSITSGYYGSNWWGPDSEIYEYNYSSVLTSVGDYSETDLSIFPNPASNNITLRWNNSGDERTLEIYQVNGIKISEQKVQSGDIVSVSDLTQGIYILKLKDNQEILATRKFVKN